MTDDPNLTAAYLQGEPWQPEMASLEVARTESGYAERSRHVQLRQAAKEQHRRRIGATLCAVSGVILAVLLEVMI